MKRMRVLIVPLAVILLLGMSGLAYGYGYLEPVGGENPHGNYLTTTNKCKVCHAVHLATGTYKLTRENSAQTACDYCHGSTGAGAGVNVYNTLTPPPWESVHLIGFTGVPPDSSKGSITLYCFTCHSVHGANTVEGSDILKKDPYGDSGTANNQTDFCADCHNKNLNRDGSNTESHIMKAPDGTPIAWAGSSTCRDCHAESGDYPHTGATHKFLGTGASGATTSTTLDNKCILCHQNPWPTPTQGVGKTY